LCVTAVVNIGTSRLSSLFYKAIKQLFMFIMCTFS